MKIDRDHFRIAEGDTVNLTMRPASIPPLYRTESAKNGKNAVYLSPTEGIFLEF